VIEPADDPDRDLMKVEALKVCDPAAPLIICGAQGTLCQNLPANGDFGTLLTQ
jgi:hypothetical protein